MEMMCEPQGYLEEEHSKQMEQYMQIRGKNFLICLKENKKFKEVDVNLEGSGSGWVRI